jgi:uncharacterized protein (TIGR00730 family)
VYRFKFLSMKISSVTIFCGSKSGNNEMYTQQAIELGEGLAQKGIQLVYGGGGKGIMGSIADACLSKNGKVIGIIPKLLLEWEAQHEGLTELIVTEDMHSRKLLLYDKCDAAIILPGGMGTLDELFEMLTWNNLRIHNKKVYILNVQGYYNHLIELLDHMEQEGFLYDNWRERFIVCKDATTILNALP